MDNYKENFIKGINALIGISEDKLHDYSTKNSIFNVLEHPNTIEPDKVQLEKIRVLKEFLTSYRLLKQNEKDKRISLKSFMDSGEYFSAMLSQVKDKERFIVAFLDRGNSIIETRVVSEGNVGEAVVYPRMILKAAMDCDCSGIILSHNHPSGESLPSNKDKEVTKVLVSIFKPLGIQVFDHIIVGDTNYYSMAMAGDIPRASNKYVSYEAISHSEIPELRQQSLENLLPVGESRKGKVSESDDRENKAER